MKIKRLFSLLLCLIILFTATACEDNEDFVLYFELDSAPKTLDPQLAQGTTEELLVKNLFEGLMRADKNGKIQKGAAESYSVSDDGLTYTFKIRQDACWQDGTPLTAEDFVFGISRGVDPKNKAPYAATLNGIAGAKEMLSGKKTTLGVTAPDSATLIIKLAAPDKDFLKVLATPICMPCHRSTYTKAKGQYGIISDHVLCNGSFRIRFWEKGEDFSMRLNKNEEYTGPFKANATALLLNVGSIEGRSTRISEGNLDMGFVTVDSAPENEALIKYEKSCYSLLINKSSPFGHISFRKAFAKTIHRNRLQNELGGALSETSVLLPDTLLLNGTPLVEKLTVTVPPEYDPQNAHSLYVEAAKEVKNLPSSISILYYGEDIAPLALLVAEGMQQALGAVVNISPTESKSDLDWAIQNGEYTLAIMPITASDDDPYVFFEQFTSNSPNNLYGFKNKDYDNEVKKITSSATEQIICDASQKAVKCLISDLTIIPIAMYSEGFAHSTEYVCPQLSPFGGVIDLALVEKPKQ